MDRSEVVLELTDGRARSLRDLTHMEYTGLIEKMRQVAGRLPDHADNRMRRKVIALFRKMGYEKELSTGNGEWKMVADMRRIYGWVKKYGKYHKPLGRHNRAELAALAALVSQVELVYQSYLKEVHR